MSALAAASLTAAAALAQQPAGDQQVQRDVRVMVGPGGVGAPGSPDVMHFVASEFAWNNKVVKGAPYSAEGVTETVQALADGNRIVHKNSSTLYRDGEGRTRREETLDHVGPWASGQPVRMVSIHDPVAGMSWSLDERNRVVSEVKIGPMRDAAAARNRVAPKGPDGQVREEVRVFAGPAGAPGDVLVADEAGPNIRIERFGGPEAHGPGPGIRMTLRDGQVRNESLGKRTMEGVEVEGTRSVMTIPAGQMGNERPIEVVSERWYSPELQVLVMSRRSDPRMGETTYQLTNLRRGEPGRALFEPPADYTVRQAELPAPIELRRSRSPQQ